MKKFTFEIPLYSDRVRFVFTSDYDEAFEFAKNKFKGAEMRKEWTEDTEAVCWTSEGYSPVVWVPRIPKSIEDYGTALHEILHACFDILRSSHLPLVKDSEEAYTYLIQYVYEGFLKKCAKFSIRAKKGSKRTNPRKKSKSST